MTIAPLNLGLGSNIGQDGQVSNVRHINCYVEDAGTDAKQRFPIYTCPGLTRYDNGSYTGVSRGLIQLNDNALIAFLGNQIVNIDTGGVASTLATIVGSNRVFLARNRAAQPQIAIVTDAGQYFILQNGSITQINDVDLPAPNSVTYLKGFFLFSIADGRIFQSDLDASNVGALAFDSANTRSEGLVRVFPHAGFLYVFGKRTTEIWQADASLASQPFVFSPIQQDIDLGCIAAHSIAQVGTGLMWVDDDGIVRYGRDGGAQRVSNHSVERAIEDLTNSKRTTMAGRQWFHEGHEFYTLFSDDFTWTYDLLTGHWHERQSYNSSKWLVNDIVAFNGAYIASSNSDGKIYRINADAYDENGSELVMDVRAPTVHNFPGKYIADYLEIDAIMGVGQSAMSQGVHFAGGSYADFGDNLDQTGSYSIEAVINADSLASTGRIICKDNGTNGWALSVGDGSPGNLRFFHRQLNTVSTDGSGIVPNVDLHIAAVFDSVGDTVKLYINGAQVGQTTGQTNAITGNTTRLTLGAAPDDPTATASTSFSGTIRDVRIWNTARSQAQIQANMFQTLTGAESGLVGYWRMDEQTGGTIADRSASNITGTLSGNAQWSDLYWSERSNPLLMVDYSDDGGKNFTGERTAPLGPIGAYQTKIRMNKWGLVRENGRQWRLRASAAVLRGIIGASIEARAAR